MVLGVGLTLAEMPFTVAVNVLTLMFAFAPLVVAVNVPEGATGPLAVSEYE